MDHTKTASTQPYRATPAAQRIARELDQMADAVRDMEPAPVSTCEVSTIATQLQQAEPGQHTRAEAIAQARRRIVTAQGIGQLLETQQPDGRTSYTAPYRCPDCRTPHCSQDEAIACCGGQELPTQAAYELMSQQLAEMLRRIP